LVDWAWISGLLIFVALMCFCIVLLAHGTRQSATTQIPAMLAPAPAASSLSRSHPNPEAPAQFTTTMTQRGSYYIAFVSPSVDPSNNVLNQPTTRIKSRGARNKLASTNAKSVKAIRGNRRNLAVRRLASHRSSTVDASRRSDRFEKGAPRSVKMLIAMWRRTSRTNKLALNESR
jgi:hypothetical protein